MANSGPPTDSDKRLERLYDYTKFHIGIYLSLAGGIATLLGSERLNWVISCLVTEHNKPVLYIALFFMLLAGMCGGVVASSTIEHTTFEDFWNNLQGAQSVSALQMFGRTWAMYEHLFFWVSMILLSLSVASGLQSTEARDCKSKTAELRPCSATSAQPS